MGSEWWGSTLTLCYTMAQTDVVMGLILHGIFLYSRTLPLFLYQSDTSWLFPAELQEYIKSILLWRDDLMSA